MATTTNFGWETPDDTDLVKDGAAAIRTALGGVDTSFVDLKGGTTGQVLAKASATDLDFTWATDASGIPATIFDAKGDIIAASAADTASRLAVGANDTVLTADSSTATGLKWATPAAPAGANFTLLGSSSLSGSQTVTISGISGKNKIMILVDGASGTSGSGFIKVRLNGSSSSIYKGVGFQYESGGSYSANNANAYNNFSGDDGFRLGIMSSTTSSSVWGYLLLDGCNSSGLKVANWSAGVQAQGATGNTPVIAGGVFNSSSTISSVSLFCSNSNFDAGDIYVYTSA